MRHSDIHQHDVGTVAARSIDALLAVVCLTFQDDVGGMFDHRPQARSYQRLVIDHHDSDHEAGSL